LHQRKQSNSEYFFKRVSQALPRLQTLKVFNQLEQQEKIKTKNNTIEFRQQIFCQSYLSCLIELVILNNTLSEIINQDQQQARNNSNC